MPASSRISIRPMPPPPVARGAGAALGRRAAEQAAEEQAAGQAAQQAAAETAHEAPRGRGPGGAVAPGAV